MAAHTTIRSQASVQSREDAASPEGRAAITSAPERSSAVSASPRFRVQVELDASWCARRLGVLAFLLVSAHVWIHVLHYRFVEVSWVARGLLDLDEEQSLGTWFSACLLLCASLASAWCSRSERAAREGRPHWRLLGLGFALLSVDEIAGFHEALNTLTESSWAIPGGILVLVSGAAYAPFLTRLPRRTGLLLLLAGCIYGGGAIGVELATEHFVDEHKLDTLIYTLTTALEEGMEMAGAILFIAVTLAHLAHAQRTALRWELPASQQHRAGHEWTAGPPGAEKAGVAGGEHRRRGPGSPRP